LTVPWSARDRRTVRTLFFSSPPFIGKGFLFSPTAISRFMSCAFFRNGTFYRGGLRISPDTAADEAFFLSRFSSPLFRALKRELRDAKAFFFPPARAACRSSCSIVRANRTVFPLSSPPLIFTCARIFLKDGVHLLSAPLCCPRFQSETIFSFSLHAMAKESLSSLLFPLFDSKNRRDPFPCLRGEGLFLPSSFTSRAHLPQTLVTIRAEDTSRCVPFSAKHAGRILSYCRREPSGLPFLFLVCLVKSIAPFSSLALQLLLP